LSLHRECAPATALSLKIVDELLRYLTIVHSGLVDRVATEDLEICGKSSALVST